MSVHLKSIVSLITSICLVSVASASSAGIGVVMTTGSVQVDGASVPGTSTIFNGSSISSMDRASSLQFSDGTRATINPGATMTVYRERSVLQQGTATQRGIDKHPVIAGELKISSMANNAVAVVDVKDSSHIGVAAQEGQTEVRSSGGTLLARLEPGTVLSFLVTQAPEVPAEEKVKSVSVCGGLDNQYQLAVSRTGVVYQLKTTSQVPDLSPYINNAITVKGLVSATDRGPQILSVLEVVKRARPCEAVGNGPIGALGAGGIALLVFIAAGGALLGYGASGGFNSSPTPVTPAIP